MIMDRTVGERLKELRGSASQDTAAARIGRSQGMVSGWEADHKTHLLARATPGLVRAFGPEALPVVGDACLLRFDDERDCEGLRPVVEGIVGALRAKVVAAVDKTEREPRDCWMLRAIPTVEEIGAAMGHENLDDMRIEGLRDLIILTRFFDGWPEHPTTDGEKRGRIRQLEAEIERLSG